MEDFTAFFIESVTKLAIVAKDLWCGSLAVDTDTDADCNLLHDFRISLRACVVVEAEIILLLNA